MRIKDPKHVQKHRIVMIGTFVGIIIVFGVWAMQIKQMFANEAASDIAQMVDDGTGVDTSGYLTEIEELIPGLGGQSGSVFQGGEEAFVQAQAQEESEELLAGELMKRFEEKAEEVEIIEEALDIVEVLDTEGETE